MRRQPFDTALVGPSALLREGLARVLETANFRVVASASRVQDIASSSKHEPVLLLIDSGDDPDGTVAQITLFKEQHPSARVAVLTDRAHLNEMASAFRAGANLYFAKSVGRDAFIKALELVMLGETIVPPELLTLICDHERGHEDCVVQSRAVDRQIAGGPPLQDGVDGAGHLSGREKSILRCIVGGDANKRIARKIDIAEATVKVHVKAILRKIRVHNRTQAAIWALKNFSAIWPSEPRSGSEVAIPSPSLLPPSAPIETNGSRPPSSPVETAAVVGPQAATRKGVGRKGASA